MALATMTPLTPRVALYNNFENKKTNVYRDVVVNIELIQNTDCWIRAFICFNNCVKIDCRPAAINCQNSLRQQAPYIINEFNDEMPGRWKGYAKDTGFNPQNFREYAGVSATKVKKATSI